MLSISQKTRQENIQINLIFLLLNNSLNFQLIAMPFKIGKAPLRRTLYYLKQGKIELREDVSVMLIGTHFHPTAKQQGAREFAFWHFAQIQFKNPHVQVIKKFDISVTPFAQTFLSKSIRIMLIKLFR